MVAGFIVALAPAGLGICNEVFNVAAVLVPLMTSRPGRIPSPVLIVPLFFYGLSAAILANIANRIGMAVPLLVWSSLSVLAVWHVGSAVWIVRLNRSRFGPRRR